MNQPWFSRNFCGELPSSLLQTGNESSGIDSVYSAKIFLNKFCRGFEKFLVCNLNTALLMNRVPRLGSDDVNNYAATSE